MHKRPTSPLTESQIRATGFISIADWAKILGISRQAALGRFARQFGKAQADLSAYVRVDGRLSLFISTCDTARVLMTRLRHKQAVDPEEYEGPAAKFDILTQPVKPRTKWLYDINSVRGLELIG